MGPGPVFDGLHAFVYTLRFPVDDVTGFPPSLGLLIPGVFLPDCPGALDPWNVLSSRGTPLVQDGFLAFPGLTVEKYLHPGQGLLPLGLFLAGGFLELALDELLTEPGDVEHLGLALEILGLHLA